MPSRKPSCGSKTAPLFNAGRGAVFTHDGRNELDASIMDGSTQAAGSVGGVTIVKNPVLLARTVMEKSPHVFSEERKRRRTVCTRKRPRYRRPRLVFHSKTLGCPSKASQEEKAKAPQGMSRKNPDHKFGTVGCVALDNKGNLGQPPPPGGMTTKRWTCFLGDTPVIGAGTYASNDACAVSCTGHGGALFSTATPWRTMCGRAMAYGGLPLLARGGRGSRAEKTCGERR